MPRKPNPRQDTGESLLLRWPDYTGDLKKRLYERAEIEGRSISNMIYYALQTYLQAVEMGRKEGSK